MPVEPLQQCWIENGKVVVLDNNGTAWVWQMSFWQIVGNVRVPT